jgi:hypothetical protein
MAQGDLQVEINQQQKLKFCTKGMMETGDAILHVTVLFFSLSINIRALGKVADCGNVTVRLRRT